MATDIKQVMLESQQVINAAEVLVDETKITQKLYSENIRHTDESIKAHNTSDTAHDDLRRQLTNMPKMISNPVVSGPSSTKPGVNGTWVLSATAMIPTAQVAKFVVTDKDENTFEVLVDNAGKGRATFTHAFTGTEGEQTYFKVKACSTHDFESNEIKYPLTITQQVPPDLSHIQTTLPEVISYGKSYEFTITGIVTDGGDTDPAKVSIICKDGKLVFPDKENLVQGQKYTFSVASDYVGPGSTSVLIKAVDGRGLSATSEVAMRINARPDPSTMVHNIPVYLKANTSTRVSVQNVVDPDGDEVTFDIASDVPTIVASKTTDIGLNENFTIRVGELSPGTNYNLTLTFKDPHGATAASTISSHANVPPNAQALVMQTDKSAYRPGETGTATFSGAADRENQELTISIVPVTGVQDIIWSKTERIPPDEPIKFTIADSPTRGDISYTVTVHDVVGDTDVVTRKIHINELPDIENLTTDIPPATVPGATTQCTISGATDPDGGDISYTITSDNEHVVITGGNNLTDGGSFSILAPLEDNVPRGSTYPIKVTVTDGTETVEKQYTVTQNVKVDLSSCTLTGVPEVLVPKDGISVSLSGAVDTVGTFTWAIENDFPDELVFSKTTGISADETITLNATSAVRGKSYSLTVVTTDELNEVVKKTFTAKINQDIQIALTSTLPPVVIPGKTYEDITFGGITDADPSAAITYEVTATGGVTVTRTSGEGGLDSKYTIVIPDVATLPRASQITFTATATDTYEERTGTLTRIVNSLPVATAATYTVPPICKPATTYDWRFDAVTDVDPAQTLEYSVTCDTESVTISDQVSTAEGLTFKAAIPADTTLARGSVIKFTLTVSDGLESSTKVISTRVNTAPDITSLVVTEIPSEVKGGAENAKVITITGATDIDTQHQSAHVVTYRLETNNPAVTFSKSTDINEGEEVTVTFKKVETNTPVAFNIYAVDTIGDKSVPKEVSTTIVPIVVTAAPSITSPGQGAEIDDQSGWTMTWSGYASTIWTGDGVYPNNS